MPLTLDDLDGQYDVHSETSYGGPFHLKGDGTTVIKNGLTYRKDKAGCIWESAFHIMDDGRVRIESTVDPSNAAPEVKIADNEGNPTRDIVVYKSFLDVETVNGKLVLRGLIKHGQETTRLTMTKI